MTQFPKRQIKDCQLTFFKLPLLITIICALIIFFFSWSYLVKVNVYTKSLGEVVYSAQEYQIESSVNGQIKKIFVKNDQKVKKGDLMLSIENIEDSGHLKANEYQIADYEANPVRLNALLSNKPLQFSSALTKMYPFMVDNQRLQYEADRTTYDNFVNLLKKNRQLIQDELALVDPLIDEKVVAGVEGAKLRGRLYELDARLSEFISRHKKALVKEHSDISARLNKLKHISSIDASKVKYSTIYSPASGVVHNLDKDKVGAVVTPGDYLATILPEDKAIIASIDVSPGEIGLVKIGMPVTLFIDSFDYIVYGGVSGSVISVSHDSIQRSDGTKYFKVRVSIPHVDIEHNGKLFRIKPGMSVVANIHISQMRILSFILKPFIKTFVHGFS